MAVGERPAHLEEGPAAGAGQGGPRRVWLRTAVIFGWVFLCSALGAALLVLPWTILWERNCLAAQAPGWSALWLSPYLRGAVSGLGLVNVGLSFCELLRLWRVWWPGRER
jgi:hypothetical protein